MTKKKSAGPTASQPSNSDLTTYYRKLATYYRKLARQLEAATQELEQMLSRTLNDTQDFHTLEGLDGLVCPSCDAIFDTHEPNCQMRLL